MFNMMRQRFRVRVDTEMVKIASIKQLDVNLNGNLEPEYKSSNINQHKQNINQATYVYTCFN